MKYPDTRSMLPAAAKDVVVQYILNRLESSRIKYDGDPEYDRVQFGKEVETDEFINARRHELWEIAWKKYEVIHPVLYILSPEGWYQKVRK